MCVSNIGCSEETKQEDSRQKRFVLAKNSLRTFISVTTLTSTVPYTCYQALITSVCGKKRQRRRLNQESLDIQADKYVLVAQ